MISVPYDSLDGGKARAKLRDPLKSVSLLSFLVLESNRKVSLIAD